MVNLNNPASLLNKQLAGIYNVRRELEENDGAIGCWSRWWELDWREAADFARLFQRAAHLVSLAAAVRREAEDAGAVGEALLVHFDEVENCLGNFSMIRQQSIDQFFDPLNATGWAALRGLSALLGTTRTVHELDVERRDTLVDDVRALIDRIRDDEDLGLSAHEKVALIERLRDVEARLIAVEVLGTEDLQEAADALVGGLLRVFWHRGSDFVQHPVTQAVFAIVNSVAVLVGLPADTLQIAQADVVAQILELGGR